MKKLEKIAVFCGSSAGIEPAYATAAQQLGKTFTTANISLIFGGGKVGLMGILADAVLANDGEVIGVMPQFLVEKEIAHPHVTKFHIANSMHERKALIAELADGFILLPGGTGSAEEFLEIFTWAQLGLHKKPCGILNVNHYYDHLLKFLEHSVASGFMSPIYRDMIIVEDSAKKLLDRFMIYHAPTQVKWVKSTAVT